VSFHVASIDALPVAENSLDFAFSLGVLHHVPDTPKAIAAIARKLKPGAPFLVCLYYAMENRPHWYRAIWKAIDILRSLVCRIPPAARNVVCDMIAASVYLPFARTAYVLGRFAIEPARWPLRYYSDKSFYAMRNDGLDRFGTALEQRFTRAQIGAMLAAVGFGDICFSPHPPFWCAAAVKNG
jgi:SAM-dependent methyltransferase